MPHDEDSISRRGFLKKGAQGAGTITALSMTGTAPAFIGPQGRSEAKRLAVLGCGGRGHGHLWALGYYDKAAQGEARRGMESEERSKFADVVAVCDAFDDQLESAERAVASHGPKPATYVDYRELLEKEKLDAVLIASPDHLHAPMAIAAAEAGLDVYVEKCMTNTAQEAVELKRTIERTGRVIQVGHQSRQDHIRNVARDIVDKGQLGSVHQIHGFLNRNGPTAGWVREIAKNGGPPRERVHWKEFLGPAPQREYDPRRFFEWRRYWDYSTGISGDLFSHGLDEMDMVMGLGIPATATASGGVYHWKDGRETPDVWSCVMEYPEQEVSLTYHSSLANSYHKTGTILLGSDATMELSFGLRVYPDLGSEAYAKELRSGKLKRNKPFIELTGSHGELRTNAQPSSVWVEGRGLTLTTRDGERESSTRLHHEEFFECMQTRKDPSAGLRSSFGVTIACHMATEAYRQKRQVSWDPKKEAIV